MRHGPFFVWPRIRARCKRVGDYRLAAGRLLQVGNGPGQFLRSYVISRVLTIRFVY